MSNIVPSSSNSIAPPLSTSTPLITTAAGSHMTVSNPSVASEEPKNNVSTSGISSHTLSTNFGSNKPEQYLRPEGSSNYTSSALDLRQSPSIVPNGNAHSNPGNMFYYLLKNDADNILYIYYILYIFVNNNDYFL